MVVLIVSVPYRGATFLNSASYFLTRADKVSVPYRGATFLNNYCREMCPLGRNVSVPYRGATFLNNHQQEIIEIKNKSFRPLSGSYISQSFHVDQS